MFSMKNKYAQTVKIFVLIGAFATLCIANTALASGRGWHHGNNGCYQQPHAPWTLSGSDMVLTIKKVTAEDPSLYPAKGVIVRHYHHRGLFNSQSVGNGGITEGEGKYSYRKKSALTAIEKGYSSLFGSQSYTLDYQFNDRSTGLWSISLDNGDTLSGSFNRSRSTTPAAQELAPESSAGRSFALTITNTISDVPEEYYPTRAVVIQTYSADGTYTGQGIGPKAIDHYGTYKYKKVAPNIAVEETIQIAETFTYPFTMVYTFETLDSGTWYQNFGDGLIIFSGTFTTFPSE